MASFSAWNFQQERSIRNGIQAKIELTEEENEAAGSGKAAFKVDRYYQTDWMPENELPVQLDGLNMDAVYESFVRQIAGELALLKQEENTTEE